MTWFNRTALLPTCSLPLWPLDVVDVNAVLYAYAVSNGSGSRDSEASFFFTLKFNDAGNWKIIEGHDMSEKEVEKREKGE